MPENSPKNNPNLVGHEEQERQLLQGLEEGRLAHGWIISGPRGMGKATLAYRFARTLLSGREAAMDSSHPVFLRIAAGSHADMLVIEPLFDAKKEEYARDITVDQVREVSQFLSLTAGEGVWRVVIVDSVDELNTNAANALLKILEEPPPQVVLLLISHNPGRLLPTIRSRCRFLKLKGLAKKQFDEVLELVAPEIGYDESKVLGELTNYSPGLTFQMQDNEAISMYNQLIALLQRLPSLDHQKLQAFAESIGGGPMHANWRLLTRLLLCLLERVVRQAGEADITPVSSEETACFTQMLALHPVPVWAAKWQEVADQFLLAERLHLDYKQFVIIFFHSITSRDEFRIGSAAA